MSHYTVLVIGENPEKQLAPFDENLRDTFEDHSDEVKEEYEKNTAKTFYSQGHNEVYKETYDKLKKLKIGGTFTYEVTKISPLEYFTAGKKYQLYYRTKGKDNSKPIWVEVDKVNKTDHPDPDVCFEGEVVLRRISPPKEITLKEKYPNYEDFLKEWHGFTDPNEIGYWKNPDAKWDWYLLGGRWAGFFKLKPKGKGEMGKKSWTNRDEVTEPGRADQALKRDIDWDGMENDNFDEICSIYDEFKVKYDNGDFKDNPALIYFDYGVENTGDRDNYIPETREQYINRRAGLRIFSFIKDGKWYERGEMGWWGAVSDEKNPDEWRTQLRNALNELPDDTLMSMYDCHI